jgi:diguanylate cyclase (GGDEF)-like protein
MAHAMPSSRSSTLTDSLFTLGRGTQAERRAALAAAAVLLVATLLAAPFSQHSGPEMRYILAVTAGCWIVADVLTALLLLSQFAVTGTVLLAVIGAAYLAIGLLALPYLLYFPGLILPKTTSIAQQQITPWLWWLRQFAFAVAVLAYTLIDPTIRRRVALGRHTHVALVATAVGVVVGCIGLTFAVIALSSHLPVLVVGPVFTPFYSHVAVPILGVVNLAAVLALAFRHRTASSLQAWLLVALFAALLNTIINIGTPERFTVGWYTAVFDTIGSAVVVLVALLAEFLRTFYNVNELARFDPLTGLRNRRTFDEYFGWSLDYATSRREGLALVMIDIDCFKSYNDRYGHGEGDECLGRVADAIRISLEHSYQVAARFGGEEFVVLLPGITATEASIVADRIRENVERLEIPHESSPVSRHVTISLGVAVASDAAAVDPHALFSRADAALYDAKGSGRNTTSVSVLEPVHAMNNVAYLRRA